MGYLWINDNNAYSVSTRSLKVTVIPTYQNELSSPTKSDYVWSYNIFVENLGTETIQIVSRYWRIINALGQIEEVEGEGVVGQQPIIKPGEAFEYTSHAKLKTSSGIMVGKYITLNKDTGEQFELLVPAFSLDCPYENITTH